MHFSKQLPKKVLYLYNKANWDEIYQNLLEILDIYFNINSTSTRTVEENWSFIHRKFLGLMQKFIPIKIFATTYHLPWLSLQLKCLIRKKQHTYNRAKSYQNPADWLEYKALQSEIHNLL